MLSSKIKQAFKNPLLLQRMNVLLVIASSIYFSYYLWWRLTSSFNHQALFLSWILFLAETFGVINFLIFHWMTWDLSPKQKTAEALPQYTVDIFVPTVNENIDILEATLTGCQAITYPHRTYVLDDGHRIEVKQLAENLDCQYIAREDNNHAKAGNINHALLMTNGEFILFLDADTVPQPDFLKKTLPYFSDPKLAFVQTPQEFYNKGSSIQHDKKQSFWHEQSLFYRVIQPGKNKTNSAFWTGTPSLFRREALEDVNGVATETITEDIHTSVRIHAKGWNSYFLNETLAFGIAPLTIHAFLLQRLRWAQGTMQLYRSKDSPLRIPGLNRAQRLSYFASFLAYFEAFQKLIFLFMPSLVLLIQVFPMQVDAAEFILRWIPYIFLSLLMNKISGRGYFNFLQTEKFNVLKMITFLSSFFTLFFGGQLKFRVTPKSISKNIVFQERRAMRAFMALFGVVTGLTLSGFVIIASGNSSLFELSTLVLIIIWAVYNAGILMLGIRDVLTKKHARSEYRYKLNITGNLHGQNKTDISPVSIEDISLKGARLRLISGKAPDEDPLYLSFQTQNGEDLTLLVKEIIPELRSDKDLPLHVQIEAINKTGRTKLVIFLFVEMPKYIYQKSREYWGVR